MKGLDVSNMKAGEYLHNDKELYIVREIREIGAFPAKIIQVVLESAAGIVCDYCKGTGRILHVKKRCGECEGTGETNLTYTLKSTEMKEYKPVIPKPDNDLAAVA